MKVVVCLFVFCLTLSDLTKAAEPRHKARKTRATCETGLVGLYQCSNGQCIPVEWLCDTEDDCGNNEDEEGCPTDCKGQHQFHCANNNCIAIEYRCDGQNDCLDNTDEQICENWQCMHLDVKCPNTNLCIEYAWLCDGDNDCGDNWDEQAQNCP